ncbi:MAG: preprotein translocase subunit SecG [Corticimicrobacter sp.]|uniref:preprotein translocase subunit SecG n=1 Tax=Corticimicrobacter sp. TaxID=2678536 RepID=UPI0032DBB557
MSFALNILMVVQIIAALSIIILVLLQQGKGADMGSSFGSGSAGSLFGATGAANFLSRMTKWAAVVFFCATGGLAYLGYGSRQAVDSGSLMQEYSSDRSVPQLPGSDPVPAPATAVPDASVPAAPAAIDVPQAPAASDVPTAVPEAQQAPAETQPAQQ